MGGSRNVAKPGYLGHAQAGQMLHVQPIVMTLSHLTVAFITH